MSGASFSSDFLNEAPMIVTPTQGAFRQVLGVVKAEVIHAPSSDTLRPPTLGSMKRPSVSSPLAGTSYGPADLAHENSDERDDEADPFSDRHTSTATNRASPPTSPSASISTFGQPSPLPTGKWDTTDSPTLPWTRGGAASRPSSMGTEAGSIIGIENATRVNLGLTRLSGESAEIGSLRSPHRTTIGRLVSPTQAPLGPLQEQQRKALANAQARAQQQGLDRRISNSSAISTDTRADSILESFPFVPPSPISNRPARSPPVSPLGQQAFSVIPPSPGNSTARNSDLPTPPSRHTLGLSTASGFSTASTGLGSFPFQIDSGSSIDPPPQFAGRQRASLDTLALTNDLASYPLAVDRDSSVLP
jgi:protein OPY2